MDDLMNKVGALIEEHVKSEVDARRVLEPSKDEIRRGARALGFWEKLVETLRVQRALRHRRADEQHSVLRHKEQRRLLD